MVVERQKGRMGVWSVVEWPIAPSRHGSVSNSLQKGSRPGFLGRTRGIFALRSHSGPRPTKRPASAYRFICERRVAAH